MTEHDNASGSFLGASTPTGVPAAIGIAIDAEVLLQPGVRKPDFPVTVAAAVQKFLPLPGTSLIKQLAELADHSVFEPLKRGDSWPVNLHTAERAAAKENLLAAFAPAQPTVPAAISAASLRSSLERSALSGPVQKIWNTPEGPGALPASEPDVWAANSQVAQERAAHAVTEAESWLSAPAKETDESLSWFVRALADAASEKVVASFVLSPMHAATYVYGAGVKNSLKELTELDLAANFRHIAELCRTANTVVRSGQVADGAKTLRRTNPRRSFS